MKRKLNYILLSALLIIMAVEIVVYSITKNKVKSEQMNYEQHKREYDLNVAKNKGVAHDVAIWGYSDVLNVLTNPNIKITKIEKGKDTDKMNVILEMSVKDSEINEALDVVSRMENLYSIQKLNIKTVEQSNVEVTLEVEFLLTP